MPLLTVRLTDEDYVALKELAGGSSMAEVVRSWIAGSSVAGQPREMELEAEVKRLKRELAVRPRIVTPVERRTQRINALDEQIAQGRATDRDVAEFSRLTGPRFGAPRPAPKPGKRTR